MSRMLDHAGRPRGGQMPGLVEAIVIDNVDPERMGRVKVRFPTLPGLPPSAWARRSTPMAGKDRGWVCLPDLGDEVLVSFGHGSVHHAVVVGALYNGVDRPPYANEDTHNNLRVFRSRSGHTATFDDTRGAEKIELVTHDASIRVTWDPVARRLHVDSRGDIEVEATGDVTLSTTELSLCALSTLSMEAGGAVSVSAGQMVAVTSGGQAHAQAPDVAITP